MKRSFFFMLMRRQSTFKERRAIIGLHPLVGRKWIVARLAAWIVLGAVWFLVGIASIGLGVAPNDPLVERVECMLVLLVVLQVVTLISVSRLLRFGYFLAWVNVAIFGSLSVVGLRDRLFVILGAHLFGLTLILLVTFRAVLQELSQSEV
jgi:hypothetical protein